MLNRIDEDFSDQLHHAWHLRTGRNLKPREQLVKKLLIYLQEKMEWSLDYRLAEINRNKCMLLHLKFPNSQSYKYKVGIHVKNGILAKS